MLLSINIFLATKLWMFLILGILFQFTKFATEAPPFKQTNEILLSCFLTGLKTIKFIVSLIGIIAALEILLPQFNIFL